MALLGVALVGGCGSSPTPTAAGGGNNTAPPSAAAAATTKIGCALAPAAMVGGALGGTVGDPAEIRSTTGQITVITCTYSSTDIDTVTLRMEDHENAAMFAAGHDAVARVGQKPQPVAGFEDEAYSMSVPVGKKTLNTLVARRAALELEVAAWASLDQEKALLTQIFNNA
jgi:hypothetical protein